MRLLTGISWTITTGNKWWSGTNSRIDLEIFRDDLLIKRLMLEPGDTNRLTRGATESFQWDFVPPVDPDNPLHNTGPDNGFPDCVVFDDGVHGHLFVDLVARGDNAWEKVLIESTVFGGDSEEVFGAFRFVPGTMNKTFDQRVVLSNDWLRPDEGHERWSLKY